MPELPEVETTRRGIEPHLQGKKLAGWRVRESRLRWPVALPAHLKGAALERIGRRGKYLLLHFETGALIVHLGMSGSLRIVDRTAPVLKHDHVDLELSDRTVLRLNDPRRFGCLLWQPGDPLQHPLLRSLGVEPLGNAFSGPYLKQAARGRKVAVKPFIMDAKVVVGVGNIYAAEALFLAGLRPAVAAGRVPGYVYDRLASAIRTVLLEALTLGGTTLRDFVNPEGQPGYFRQRLNVYGRDDLPCRVCGTPLTGIVLGNRATVYCAKCQRSQGFSRQA